MATRLRRPRAGARNYWVLLERKGISVKQGLLSHSGCDFDGIVVAQNFLMRLALGFHVRIARDSVLFTTLAAYSHYSIGFAAIELRYVFRHCKNAGLAVEVDSVGRVDRKFDLARFCSKPGDLIAHGHSLPQFLGQPHSIGRVAPHVQFVDGAAQYFCPRIAVSALERRVHVNEPSLSQGCDRERNRARAEDFLKLVS